MEIYIFKATEERKRKSFPSLFSSLLKIEKRSVPPFTSH